MGSDPILSGRVAEYLRDAATEHDLEAGVRAVIPHLGVDALRRVAAEMRDHAEHLVGQESRVRRYDLPDGA